MTIFEFRNNFRETSAIEGHREMSLDEAAQSLLIIRDELCDNGLQANPLMISHLLDVAWLLSSPTARNQWEANANKAIEKMISESASALGSIKSPRKAAASRENGRKGGRPKMKE